MFWTFLMTNSLCFAVVGGFKLRHEHRLVKPWDAAARTSAGTFSRDFKGTLICVWTGLSRFWLAVGWIGWQVGSLHTAAPQSFDSHIKQTSRIAFFYLCNVAKIRPILSQKDAEKLVHAFVTSRLDYCNSLLSGCTKKSLKTLQLIQNAAARVLTGTRKRDHISPVLASLHWLPVKSRIEFKVLLLTYKALNGQAPLYVV